MTTVENDQGQKLARMQANLAKMEQLSERLIAAVSKQKSKDAALNGPSNEIYMKAATAYLAAMMQNPSRVLEHQVGYWTKTMKHYVEAQQALAGGDFAAPEDKGPKDRRFSNPLWDTHPAFNYVKQQYFINAEAVQTAVADLEDIDPAEKRRVEYFTKQIVDMLSPTNFLGTNPDALERAVATDGESLVKGLENLIADIESHDGEVLPTLSVARTRRS